MKVHCRQRWREISEPSGAGGAAKEVERGNAQKRAVGEGLGDSLEERRGYGDVTWRETGGTSGHVGKSDVVELQTG